MLTRRLADSVLAWILSFLIAWEFEITLIPFNDVIPVIYDLSDLSWPCVLLGSSHVLVNIYCWTENGVVSATGRRKIFALWIHIHLNALGDYFL